MNHNKEKRVNVLDMSKEVAKAAKTVALQWPGVVEADDLEQDLYMKLLESPASVEKLLTEFDDKSRLNALISMGHQIASRERVDYEVFSGNFRYSVNEVKKLLEKETFKDAQFGRASTSTDLVAGMERLRGSNPQYAEIIERRYLTKEPIETSAEKTRLSRALTSLTTQMNHSHKREHADRFDGPGSRKAISNSAARVISRMQYEGEEVRPSPGANTRWKFKDEDFSTYKGERL